jgi:hypothetical protein
MSRPRTQPNDHRYFMLTNVERYLHLEPIRASVMFHLIDSAGTQFIINRTNTKAVFTSTLQPNLHKTIMRRRKNKFPLPNNDSKL